MVFQRDNLATPCGIIVQTKAKGQKENLQLTMENHDILKCGACEMVISQMYMDADDPTYLSVQKKKSNESHQLNDNDQ